MLNFSGSSLRRNLLRIAAMITFTCHSHPSAQAFPSVNDEFSVLPDGEADYVSRLIDLRMFEVAAQYCERSAGLRNDIEQHAEWECLLATCRLRQVWTLASDSRLETIRIAVQRLSDFRANQTPSLQRDIQLRLAQLELLGAAGQIQELLHRPISSKRRVTIPVKDASFEFSLKAVEQAYADLQTLLKQLEATRKDLDAAFLRVTRDRIRVLMAQLLLTQSRLSAGSESQQRLKEAKNLVEPISRDASDQTTKFRARAMLVELSLEATPNESIDLLLKSLDELTETTQQKVHVESLRVRLLLRKGVPSDALQQSIAADDLLFETSEELKVFRLECLLQLYELLFKLPDATSSSEMKKNTAGEFNALRNRVEASLSGPWSERCRQISLRFHRVGQVGPEIADVLEDVDALRNQNQFEAAIEQLQKIVDRVPTEQQTLRASVNLELGQLLLKQQRWAAAETALQESSTLFVSSGQTDDAAAADLLRIFSIGQQWQKASSSDSANTSTTLTYQEQAIASRYRSALDSHIQTFVTSATTRKALEWRALLDLESSPLTAAADLIQSTETSSDATQQPVSDAEQVLRLAMAAEALLNLRLRGQTLSQDEQSRLRSLVATLQERSQIRPTNESGESESHLIFDGLQLALMICEPKADPAFWETNDAKARNILESLSRLESSKKQDSSLAGLGVHRHRLRAACEDVCHAILIASCFRRLEDLKQIEPSRAAIIARPRRERDRSVALLACQLSNAEPSAAGSPQLARFLTQLVLEPSPDDQNETNSVLISRLKLLKQLCVFSNDWKPYVDTLDRLTKRNLTERELDQISELLFLSDPQRKIDESVSKAEMSFWHAVQKRTKRGDDLWLEASLRLAEGNYRTGNKSEALRILNVVNALFPSWGNESRQKRAVRLMELVKGKQEPSP